MQRRIHRLSAAVAAALFVAASSAGAVPLLAPELPVTHQFLLAPLLTPAQEPAPVQELPPAQEVIARYVEVIGGSEAIRGHSSTYGRGTMELLGQGITGDVQIYAAAADKSLLVVSFADLGIEIKTGYNGEVGWSTDPMTGERILQGDELQQIVDESDYYSDLHDPSRFQSMETVEMTEFAGRSTYKVRLVYNSGRESFEYFDVENGRLVGEESLQYSLMGAVNVRAFASEYKQFDDIMVPTKIVQELGPGQTVQLTISSMEYDNVDPSMFALPASIEALIR